MRLAGFLLLACALSLNCALAAVEPDVPAEEPAVAQVALVRVHLPLTGNADQVLEATISRVRDRLLDEASRTKDARRPLLVLQLDPHLQSVGGNLGGGAGSQFERVLSLARFLCSREMAGIKTIAFVPQSIRGHSTLLALACEELVMAPDVTLGEAGVDEPLEGTIGQTVIGAYREIATARRTMPVALALGMIDASAEVLQLETEQGTEFVLRSERAEIEREVLDEQVLVSAGSLASYDGREGRQFGFVKFLAANREGLARALNVPAAAIREEDTLTGEWSLDETSRTLLQGRRRRTHPLRSGIYSPRASRPIVTCAPSRLARLRSRYALAFGAPASSRCIAASVNPDQLARACVVYAL